MDTGELIRQQSQQILNDWIQSCTRGKKVSRNTVAVGMVVLDHLRAACPVEREDVISSGGEIKGARSRLRSVLLAYGVPGIYLKEATTRQVHQDGQRLFESLDWGKLFVPLSEGERNTVLLELIDTLAIRARAWLERQNLKLTVDRNAAPATWVRSIVENAKQRSGGVVEQHLIGAKLQAAFPDITVANHPAHAGDQQTSRDGDFVLLPLVCHVTAAPSSSVIEKCAANIRAGQHPMLLVPQEKLATAYVLAEQQGIHNEVSIESIESFVAVNVMELAVRRKKSFYDIMREIVAIYNARLSQVETDQSLRIELR